MLQFLGFLVCAPLIVICMQCKSHHTNVQVDMDSVSVYPNFNFQALWTLEGKHFWKSKDFDFEQRYQKLLALEPNGGSAQNSSCQRPLVEVFVLPFSHNDPGWKMTFENYFRSMTQNILNNAVQKLTVYKNMTFAWSEISFLSKWWDHASFIQKEQLRRLVLEGRFEILTGGWVMPDEATTSLFALLNQLIEGHQWIYHHLRTAPTSAWSIDSFGHGSTIPYILKRSGLREMMIQRLHYGWKNYFAQERKSDFIWVPRWSDGNKEDGIICHNAHYDLYPTKHSCGPHSHVCMKFDFRKIEGKREEHLIYHQTVGNSNLYDLSDSLIGQYRRTSSLTTHNKVITGLGGDFRFEESLEWDQQFENYNKLMRFINSHKSRYLTAIKFGTLREYFRETNTTLSTFNGDFFPYSDVIFPFSPAYWTGYFSTRPFWKKMSREAEDELFKAEILFTFAYNLMRQRGYSSLSLYRNFDNLVQARQSVALFQHHDGITGTSPRSTMLDYGIMLDKAWTFSQHIQKIAIESLWRKELNITTPPLESYKIRPDFNEALKVVPTKLYGTSYIVKKVVIFNSVGWKRSHLVRLIVEDHRVIVRGPQGEPVLSQLNYVPHVEGHRQTYELIFVASLPPLSLVTYEVSRQMNNSRNAPFSHSTAVFARLVCKNCNSKFEALKEKSIKLDNGRISARFDGNTGHLQQFRDKFASRSHINVSVSFGKYESGLGGGAYLLRPFVSSFQSFPEISNTKASSVFVFDGPVMSEVQFISKKIRTSTWIVKNGDNELKSSLFMSNTLNISEEWGEFIMRIRSDINNVQEASVLSSSRLENSTQQLVFFTDTNGHGVEKRAYLSKLPYQANHYPITNFAFIQDPKKKLRLSLLVDRSHGVTSSHAGSLELIIDRRLRYDDSRGMEEGIMDSEVSTNKYVLKMEPFSVVKGDDFKNWETSLEVQRGLKYMNHEPSIFLYDTLVNSKSGRISLLSEELPEDVHMLNLRTYSRSVERDKSLPSNKALMIFQRLGYKQAEKDCVNQDSRHVRLNTRITFIRHSLTETNLVGTKEVVRVQRVSNKNRTKTGFHRFQMKDVPIGKQYELSSYTIHF